MKDNNIIKNLIVRAKPLALSFVLMATPLATTGCYKKVSETNVEKTIEQNKSNTYMDSVLKNNKELKENIKNLEAALAADPNNEEAKEFIIANTKSILEESLLALIKSTMCDANNESAKNYNDYIINYQNDKYDGDRVTITRDNESYLVKDGFYKRLTYDYLELSQIDEKTDYEKLRNIAVQLLNDIKIFISNYNITVDEPSIVTSYFESSISKVISTKKRKK